MTVTRLEIAEHILDAFDHPPATRTDVLGAATGSSARSEVLEILQGLPEEQFPNIRAVWKHLPDVPVDA